MTNVINLSSYEITGKERVLLDANVLLYLYGPFNGSQDYGYSDFLEAAILNDVEMYVNESVLSEFVNRNIKMAYEQYVSNNNLNKKRFQFKRNYRSTDDFNANYELSLNIIKDDILSIAKFSSNSNQEIEIVLSNQELLDFNDELIIRNAEINGYGIVTHDRDFLRHSSSVNIYQY